MNNSITLKWQNGYTLLELSLALFIMSAIAVAGFQYKAQQLNQSTARQLGLEIGRHTQALQAWASDNSADQSVGDPSATRVGFDWLKSSECGGEQSDEAYVACTQTFGTNNKTTHYGLTPSSRIYRENGRLNVITTFTPLDIDGRSGHSILGLAALVASGFIRTGDFTAGKTARSSVFYCITDSASEFCTGREGQIVLVVNSDPSTDRWLRRDGGNMMNRHFDFDPDQSDVDDSGFSLRQVRNVARILNGTSNESLFIGSGQMQPPPTLADHGVIVAADQAVLGSLTSLDDFIVEGGDLVITQADGEGGSLDVSGNGDIGRDIASGETISSENLRVTGDANFRGRVSGLQENSAILSFGFQDPSSGDYRIDMRNTSKIRSAEFENTTIETSGSLRIPTIPESSKGSSCMAGEVGITESGEIIYCRDNTYAIEGHDKSVVISGEVSHRRPIPLPSGYEIDQCMATTMTNSQRIESNEVVRSSIFTEAGSFYANCDAGGRPGSCEYVVACTKDELSLMGGPYTTPEPPQPNPEDPEERTVALPTLSPGQIQTRWTPPSGLHSCMINRVISGHVRTFRENSDAANTYFYECSQSGANCNATVSCVDSN